MALAYFLTFHTFGTWLHGHERGSVDREHNQFGTEFLPADEGLHEYRKELMTQPPYFLDADRRNVVLNAILEHGRFKNWQIWAVHVRTNHVHLVVSADVEPERILSECKSYASRALNAAGFDEPARKRWARHGSTRHLFDRKTVAQKIHYAVHEQGEPMAVYERAVD